MTIDKKRFFQNSKTGYISIIISFLYNFRTLGQGNKRRINNLSRNSRIARHNTWLHWIGTIVDTRSICCAGLIPTKVHMRFSTLTDEKDVTHTRRKAGVDAFIVIQRDAKNLNLHSYLPLAQVQLFEIRLGNIDQHRFTHQCHRVKPRIGHTIQTNQRSCGAAIGLGFGDTFPSLRQLIADRCRTCLISFATGDLNRLHSRHRSSKAGKIFSRAFDINLVQAKHLGHLWSKGLGRHS